VVGWEFPASRMVVGRNEHIAVGVTNAYGDAQDLYVETVDPKNPDRYLEGDQSLPFEVITEKLVIKDKKFLEGYGEGDQIRLTRADRWFPEWCPALRRIRPSLCAGLLLKPWGLHRGDQIMMAKSRKKSAGL